MTKNNNILVLADLESPLIKSRIEMLQELGHNNYILHNASCLELQSNIVKEYSKLGIVLQNPAIKSPKIRRFVSFFLTLYLVLRLRPKLIVVHWASRLWQSVAIGLFGSKVIVHTMNGDINPIYDGHGRKKFFTSFLLNRAAAITVKSEYGLRLLRNNFSDKLLSKAYIVSWGVNESLFYDKGIDARKILGLNDDSKFVFCPRSMQAIYHKKEVAESFFEFLDTYGGDVYLVVSTMNAHKEYMDKYKEFVLNSKYSDNVIFAQIRHNEMPALLSQADAVVSYTKSDGLSQTIMEGLLLGAKIVCYDMPDYEGILSHRSNAFLFKNNLELKGGIAYFLDGKKTTHASHSVAEMLSYEIQKQRYIGLCKKIIGDKRAK